MKAFIFCYQILLHRYRDNLWHNYNNMWNIVNKSNNIYALNMVKKLNFIFQVKLQRG